MTNPRETALGALIEFRRRGAWPDKWLKNALNGLAPDDAALVTAMVYGVLQQRGLIDFYLQAFSSIKLKRVMPQVLDVLRLGAYQLIFMDKIPAFAAINESVSLAKKHGGARAGGFANALLRAIERQKLSLPEPSKADIIQYLSIKYSHPQPLCESLVAIFGAEEAEKLMAANNAPPPLTARVNTLKTDTTALKSRIEGAEIHEYLPDSLILATARGVGSQHEAGLLHMMDAASQLAVHALAPAAGSRLLDLCAAPGGKTLMAAQLMDGSGQIEARDVHRGKIDNLAKTALNFGAENIISAQMADAALFDQRLEGKFDFVICDVPCSGFGIIRKKPDIRYKSLEGIEKLPELQLKIAQNAAKYLKPGGAMIYSTCTVFPRENEQVVQKLLERNGDIALEGFTLPHFGQVSSGMITLLPHIDQTDGFFIAKLRRKH